MLGITLPTNSQIIYKVDAGDIDCLDFFQGGQVWEGSVCLPRESLSYP